MKIRYLRRGFGSNLGDPQSWQPIYSKYGIIDTGPRHDWSSSSAYILKGQPVPAHVIDAAQRSTPSHLMNEPSGGWDNNPSAQEAVVKWQVEYIINNYEPWKGQAAYEDQLRRQTIERQQRVAAEEAARKTSESEAAKRAAIEAQRSEEAKKMTIPVTVSTALPGTTIGIKEESVIEPVKTSSLTKYLLIASLLGGIVYMSKSGQSVGE